MKKATLSFLSMLMLLFQATPASSQMDFKYKPGPVNKIYFSTGFDSYILSTATLEKPGMDQQFTTPRFTAFFNFGLNANFDFSKHFGILWGLSVKNIGFIEKYDQLDSTVKRRVYTLGIPVGLKIGNVQYGNYFIVGGGVDFPFNYKEKGFVKRGDKEKFNEWFSSRTPAVLPYVFVGANLRPGLLFKLQYYPGNFMNPDFTTMEHNITRQPYKGYDVHIVMFTFGFNIPYHPKEMIDEIKTEVNAEKEI